MSDPKIFNSKPLSFITANNIPISFIIHTKDQFSNTSNILQSILVSSNPYEVILINDNSLNKEYFNEITSYYKFIKLINNLKNHSDAINESLDFCENNWIFYINADFFPNNFMWLSNMIVSMMNLKSKNVKFISPFIQKFQFFDLYKDIKEDIILTDHFLPFNVGFFHKDLFKILGKIESNDNILEISKNFYEKMSKRNFKQAICPGSLFSA